MIVYIESLGVVEYVYLKEFEEFYNFGSTKISFDTSALVGTSF